MEPRRNDTGATMKDVARAAGVSTATVSRTLMNPEKVSVQTRQKVENAVLEVGYYPHNLSRGMKRNESRTILVIVPDIGDPFFTDIIVGIEEIAAKHGYLVLIGDCRYQHKPEHTFVNLIVTKQIDGMVLLGSDVPFDSRHDEQRHFPPMVMANEFAPELELPLCQYRVEGYIQAMRRMGMPVRDEYLVRGDFTHESGAECAAQLLALPEPPTAIFCHNDIMAIGVLWAARKQGLTLPQDLSVVGFDDLPAAQYCSPTLTTIAQPRYEIGRQSFLLLLEQLQGHTVAKGSRLLDSDLIIRESACAPKS